MDGAIARMKDIVISNLYKSYDNNCVLNDLSIVLKSGQITALMAPSGAGKTTLLRILMNLETADAGSIEGLDDSRISTVFQEDRLCEQLNTIDNIRLVNTENTRKDIIEALKIVELGHAAYQKVSELSGGMRRRVSILRALMSKYDLLLLDEPFRGLDAETKKIVMLDTLKRCEGKTVLLVTHDSTELEVMGIQNCIHLPVQ